MFTAEHEDAIRQVYLGKLTLRPDGYYIVPTSIFINKIDIKMPPLPSVDFFIEKDFQVKLLRRADQPYSHLALSTHSHVLIAEKDLRELQQYAEHVMFPTRSSTPEAVQSKMETLRKAAVETVEDMFEHPSPERLVKGKRVVSSFVYVLMREPEAFLVLARLSSHDPYTLTHSVGTAVNAIILGRKIGIKDQKELEELGMGGLLHDIGKVKVDPGIINKPGKLDDREWEQMKLHSQIGFDLIKPIPEISDASKQAVLLHHEDKQQGGYPTRMPWNEIHLFAKLVGISDVYNALTTNRSYSKARTPFDAFRLMADSMKHKLDDELFKQLVLIYGGRVEDLKKTGS